MIRTPHVSMDFKRLSIPEKIVFGSNVFKQMGLNTATFATPDVTLVTLNGKNQALSDTAQAAEMGDRQKVSALRKAEKEWDTTFGTQAKYIDRIANGIENIILLAGFTATASETTPSTTPGIVLLKKLNVNAEMGSIHIEVEMADRAIAYLYLVSNTSDLPSFVEDQFTFSDNSQLVAFILETHRKVDFHQLPSRATLYVSVVAFNTMGFGPISPPVAINTL